MALKKSHIKKFFFLAGWIMLAMGTITLLVAAYNKNQVKRCTGVSIQIDGPDVLYFVDKEEVLQRIKKYSGQQVVGQFVRAFKLHKISTELIRNPWIKKATMYFDVNGVLRQV